MGDLAAAHHLADDEVDFRVDEVEVDDDEVVGKNQFYHDNICFFSKNTYN